MAAKTVTVTVTVKQAGPGIRRVLIDEWVFPIGEPVREVPDSIRKRLSEVRDVKLHVAAPPSRASDDDDQPGGSS